MLKKTGASTSRATGSLSWAPAPILLKILPLFFSKGPTQHLLPSGFFSLCSSRGLNLDQQGVSFQARSSPNLSTPLPRHNFGKASWRETSCQMFSSADFPNSVAGSITILTNSEYAHPWRRAREGRNELGGPWRLVVWACSIHQNSNCCCHLRGLFLLRSSWSLWSYPCWTSEKEKIVLKFYAWGQARVIGKLIAHTTLDLYSLQVLFLQFRRVLMQRVMEG